MLCDDGRPMARATGSILPGRILHVSPSFFPAHRYGGSVTTLYELCRAQLRAGLDVRVLTSDSAGPGERLPGVGGRWVHDHLVPTFYARVAFGEQLSPELACRLPELVRWADLVHVTGVWNATSQLGILASLAAGRPCVVWPCGALLPWALGQGSRHKRRVLRLLKPLLRRVSGWHATSEQEADALRQLGVVGKAAAVGVVPNGVTVGNLRAPALRPPGGPRLMTLGRIHPVKNLELAIESLAELRRDAAFAAATLTLAGPESPDGYGAHLRQLARERGVERAVQLPGLVTGEAKERLLGEADVFWLPSHMESFGNVVAEALAAGTPVVAARTTPWQLLGELGVGRWVEPTPTAFAQATRELIDPKVWPEARSLLAGRCQEVAAARFAWPAVEAGLRQLYRRAAEC